MKRIKNKKILIAVIFVLFALSSKPAFAEEMWGYLNNLVTEVCPFSTEEDCKADMASKKVYNKECTVITSCPNPIKINANEIVNEIEAKKTTPSTESNDYNLLAPIGEYTKAPDNIGDYFNLMFKLLIGICGVLAVVMIVIGGIQYMGNESIFGKTEAKSQISKAILGLIIALGSYALLNTIDPSLLGKNGVNIKQVSAEIDDETETKPWSESESITGTTKNCTEGYTNVNTYGQPASINVCKSMSVNLKKMLDKAKADGYVLSGYGSRSYDSQVRLRTNNKCPDIYNSPSNECTPPTARPGHSKHESGKAVDFNCNGEKMKGSTCFKWLQSNAGTYGFKNLSSEAWHWSDDGR